DADGSVYLAGHVGGALPGQTNAGLQDAFALKFDAAGNLLWARQFGTVFDLDDATGVAVDGSGVYVVGFIFGALPGQSNTGSRDAFVRKYDVDGNELWTRQFGSSSSDEAR